MRKSDTNIRPSDVKKGTSHISTDIKPTITINRMEPPEGIINRVTDYHNDKLANLVYDHATPSFKHINLYNNKIYYMQKIWIRTPVLKVFRPIYPPNDKIRGAVPLSLLLIDSIKDVSNLISFIKRLEIKVTKIIRAVTNNSKLKLKSSLKNYDGFPPVLFVNMPFNKVNDQYEFSFNIYNKANQRINIDSIKKASETCLYLELSDIWYSDTHYGCTWNVMQMKIYPEIIYGECLFEDEEEDIKSHVTEKQECYHCLYCPSNHIRTMYSFSPQYNCTVPPPPPPMNTAFRPPPPPLPTNMITSSNDRNINKEATPYNNKPAFTLSLSDLLSVKLKPLDKRIVDRKRSPLSTNTDSPKSADSNTNKNILECKKNLK